MGALPGADIQRPAVSVPQGTQAPHGHVPPKEMVVKRPTHRKRNHRPASAEFQCKAGCDTRSWASPTVDPSSLGPVLRG
jgi:hypothetical protein